MIPLILYLLMQTSLAISPQRIAWTQSGISPTVARTYIYKLYITEESGVKTSLLLSNITCVGIAIGAGCSTALPSNGNVAIITGNHSQLTATNPKNMIEGPASAAFIGNQGCIFRNNLYKIGARVTITAYKVLNTALLNEFKAAKFKLISSVPKGNSIVVTEECVGYIVH